MRRAFLLLLPGMLFVASTMPAQSPMPVIVPAASAQAIPRAAVATPQNDAAAGALLKTLQETKAANDDILQKQAATLSQLEEIEKTADQLRVLTKRG